LLSRTVDSLLTHAKTGTYAQQTSRVAKFSQTYALPIAYRIQFSNYLTGIHKIVLLYHNTVRYLFINSS